MEVPYLVETASSTVSHPSQQIVREIMPDTKSMYPQIHRRSLSMVDHIGISDGVFSPGEHENSALFLLIPDFFEAGESLNQRLQDIHLTSFGLQLIYMVTSIILRFLVVRAPVRHIDIFTERKDGKTTPVRQLMHYQLEELLRRFECLTRLLVRHVKQKEERKVGGVFMLGDWLLVPGHHKLEAFLLNRIGGGQHHGEGHLGPHNFFQESGA